MMKPLSLLFFGFFLLTIPSVAQEERYYKGNLHTHSYWSDGDEFPEMIMEVCKGKDHIQQTKGKPLYGRRCGSCVDSAFFT